ncbi:SMI1/KNR4 family protein [Duganella sp. LX20W]|uniref:SMI1/KNR4 family protein n=1 Tax=Rugamonas brunnea TaxID=2758569 RepID=A0A7W2ETX0_9BURK|nr:SMI1/KNR4 family protein [Rugamonas brunnea]MBA5638559.1 SMI1/KNR4 family protein [Rugamonas brunnea]
MLPEIPSQYVEYLNTNGAFEGYTTDEDVPGYIALWTLEEIPRHNRDIDVETHAPGFIVFAGNGGGEVLAFDASGAVYMLPMIGMASDCAILVAENFQSLAERFVR